jgi:FkbM family methyltransferase
MAGELTVRLPGPGGEGAALSITGAADDWGVIGTIARSGAYEPHLMRVIADVVRPDWVCLDVGANIGVVAAVLAQLCPDGRVYAVEPSGTSFRFLERNVEANGLRNVEPVPLGFYSEARATRLHSTPTHPGGAFISETDVVDPISEDVELVRLDDWAATAGLARVDLVKLDVEGAELAVLDGARATLQRDRPVLLLECNPVTMRRFHRSNPHDLHRVLVDLYGEVGYVARTGEIRRIETARDLDLQLDRWGLTDLVCGVDLPPPRGRAERLRVQGDRVRRRALRAPVVTRGLHRLGRAVAPAPNYVQVPGFRVVYHVNRYVLSAGVTTTIPVDITNTSRYWYDSRMWENPVTATYRWRRGDGDGIRTFFDPPLAPGCTQRVDLVVATPLEPGAYDLVVTLVQEGFGWFDELDPALTYPVPVLVR